MTDHPHTRETAWIEEAACREVDPELFYIPGAERAAQAICRGCDVSDSCLSYALARDEPYGVWGGMTDRQRRKLLRENGMKPALELGPCDRCGRIRYSSHYGTLLPEGGVWNGNNKSRSRKLCAECDPDTEDAESHAKGVAA